MKNKKFDRVDEMLAYLEECSSVPKTAWKFGCSKATIYKISSIHYNKMREEMEANHKRDTFDFAICSHFGCGKHLTREEQLYGNRCINHLVQPLSVNIIDKYLYE